MITISATTASRSNQSYTAQNTQKSTIICFMRKMEPTFLILRSNLHGRNCIFLYIGNIISKMPGLIFTNKNMTSIIIIIVNNNIRSINVALFLDPYVQIIIDAFYKNLIWSKASLVIYNLVGISGL